MRLQRGFLALLADPEAGRVPVVAAAAQAATHLVNQGFRALACRLCRRRFSFLTGPSKMAPVLTAYAAGNAGLAEP